MDDVSLRFAQRCRELRAERGLSIMDMVRLHDWHAAHYQRIERGVANIRIATAEKVARSFGVELGELFDGV